MEFVKLAVQDRIGIISLDRPAKLNAMPRQMYKEISAALVQMDNDRNVWVIIVRSTTPKAFSAGADLSILHTVLTSGDFDWTTFRPDRFDMGLQVSKPVIASIDGYCLAGGLELALSCDMRVAAETAVFGTPEVRWSVLHGFGALVLPRLMSLGKAMELMMTGEEISAAEAERLGLVNKVVAPDQLEAATLELARKIARNGPIAVRMTKEITLRGLDMSLHDGLRLYRELNRTVHTSKDSVEGMHAWRDRRDPEFTNS
jgi:enoyl-CoA hydratase/carnithine racemase